MHQLAQELPGTNTVWEGMAVGYIDMPAGTDFTPVVAPCFIRSEISTGATFPSIAPGRTRIDIPLNCTALRPHTWSYNVGA